MENERDRRRHPRFLFERHVAIRFGSREMTVLARDVSQGGFCFHSEVQLRVGDRVMLGLRHDSEVQTGGLVRYVHPQDEYYVIGVERADEAEQQADEDAA